MPLVSEQDEEQDQGDTPLNQLCGICHLDVPKYRCPRCSMRTCSLACVKRHKSWASCSGVRSQTEYVRRSELLTPAGVDRDFNFITGIERGMDNAERTRNERGIESETGKPGNLAKGELLLENGWRRAGVRVERMPKGMTRRQLNKTLWSKKLKCLIWTIEWVVDADVDVNVDLHCSRPRISKCIETETVANAYALFTRHERRRMTQAKEILPESKKRKACDEVEQDKEDKAESTESLVRDLFFYLHRPLVPAPGSDVRVLHPIDTGATLSACFEGATLVEFPTIYVLPYAADALPLERYVLEANYVKAFEQIVHECAEIKDTDAGMEVPLRDTDTHADDEQEKTRESAVVDEKRVLEMALKDLSALTNA